METDRLVMVLKLNCDNDWTSLYGMCLRKGEWQYITSSNNPFITQVGGRAVESLNTFRPLKIDNTVSVEIEETHEGSGLSRA